MQRRQIVTCFLLRHGRVLLLRRSARVGSYRGKWAAVSGTMEAPDPVAEAYREVAEETGLRPPQVSVRAQGDAVEVADPERGMTWVVHPVLAEVAEDAEPRLDWEHDAAQWVAPEEVARRDTVPRLAEALASCLAAARIAALRADRERGSAALAAEALDILAEAARLLPPAGFLEPLGGVARRIAAARPAMVAMENRVHQVMANLHIADAAEDALPAIAAGLCEALATQAPLERAAAARHAAEALAGAKAVRVLTLSWSDTVADALAQAARAGVREVVLPEGAPLADGRRAADRLAKAGLQVEVVPDAEFEEAARRCDAMLVGADAVLEDGSVVNRAGTRSAARAMHGAGRPCWVVCEEAKVTWRMTLLLEDEPGGALFEVTPAELVTAVITGSGPLGPGDLAPVAERWRRRAAWMEP